MVVFQCTHVILVSSVGARVILVASVRARVILVGFFLFVCLFFVCFVCLLGQFCFVHT